MQSRREYTTMKTKPTAFILYTPHTHKNKKIAKKSVLDSFVNSTLKTIHCTQTHTFSY